MKNNKAQAIIEFTFACIMLMILFYGLIQSVRWVMMDLAERRYDHDNTLIIGGGDASVQLRDNFHRLRPLDAVIVNK